MSRTQNGGGNFDWVAPVYDVLAFLVFGHKLKQAQQALLDRIPSRASILLVGGGTGWLLEQLLLRCQPRRVLYLETSRAMVNRATERVCRKALPGTVVFQVGDESTLAGEEFDVILTPFLLDLFTEQTLNDRLIPRLAGALTPKGIWLVTDFVNPPYGWQKGLLWTMIRFFRFTAGIETRKLANWQACLELAGLRLQLSTSQVGGMVSAELWIKDRVDQLRL